MEKLSGAILIIATTLYLLSVSCTKSKSGTDPKVAENVQVFNVLLNGKSFESNNSNVNITPNIKIQFSQPIKIGSLSEGIKISDANGNNIQTSFVMLNGDSTVQVQMVSPLAYLSKFTVNLRTNIESKAGGKLYSGQEKVFITALDSSRKFPVISDDELLTKVQQQTFKYFWDFGHPTSGLARERNNSGDMVTIGGSGFGVMAIIVGIHRGFITRAEGLARMQKMVGFLKDKAQIFHGAFSHWLNGNTGVVQSFSANDNGADLVETSFMIQGLFAVRQYFNGANADEAALRNDINTIINRVEWNWFTQGGQDVLYWHWSPDKGWIMNHKIVGWNECLITYVLAAASTTYPISKTVYDKGWANNGAIKNGNNYYGNTLPLGENLGGPLFFAHYSFLGLNPTGLSDAYANYEMQTKNHSLINYNYCKTNPRGYYGYSDSVWGLTASDIKGSYTASSPTNDQSFIAPTAALSSMPYTPAASMAALKFYYYVLGDKLFKEYGFVDAFSLDVQKNNGAWFADSFLAIDQGPIIVMIENYRSQLIWNLFMSAPEVRTGLTKLGFTY